MVSPPSEVLPRQLKRWRDERKLSTQALADRLSELGSALNRRVISKIESGERGVSLDEWLQLAHALAVPPPLLLVDLKSGQDVAVAPGVVLHPWLVWEWVTGEEPPLVRASGGGAFVSRVEEFGRAKTAIFLYRREANAANAVQNARSAMRAAEFAGDEAADKAARSQYADALKALAQVLDEMVENGVEPPGKPREWIETIRSLELSRYPDRLAVHERGREVAEDGGPDQAD